MLSSQARTLLLVEKAKQTNESYGKEHIKTIKLFEEARGVFSNDLEFWQGKGKRFHPREKSPEEKIEEREECHTETKDQEQVEKDDETHKHDEEIVTEEIEKEVVKEVKPKKKVKRAPPTKLSDERLRQIREMYWNNCRSNGETFELDGEEYFLDPNGYLVKSIKFNASKKVDTRWDPGHPMFQKLRNKIKVPELKGIVQKINANDISSSNVYVTEAKRIFPKAFEGDKTLKTENKKGKKIKMKSVDISNTGPEDNDSLTRIESNEMGVPVKGNLKRYVSVPNKLVNSTQPSDEKGEGNIRKLRKAKSVSSKITYPNIDSVNGHEDKKLRTKTTKHDNFVEPKKDHGNDATGNTSKENKAVSVKKKKNIKYKKTDSSKEFEVDQAFLNDQYEFNEKTVKLEEVEIARQSKGAGFKTHSVTSHKDRLSTLEFQTQLDELNNNNTQNEQRDGSNITSPDENHFSDEMIASRKMKIKTKSKKKRKINNNGVNAVEISREARADQSRVQRAKRIPVEFSRSSSFVSGKSDVSMQTAVEIMQSRGKFYSNHVDHVEVRCIKIILLSNGQLNRIFFFFVLYLFLHIHSNNL